MKPFLKRTHLFSLSFGLLAGVGFLFNVVLFILLYPRITGFMELDPVWDTLGMVAALNMIVIALFHLASVLTLLAQLVQHKTYSPLRIGAVTLGVLSGFMVLGDIALLSDIGKEYLEGWQTRGEWIVLFTSYGLHALYLASGLTVLINNLQQDSPPPAETAKDETLFLSLLSTGWICGCIGLLAVSTVFFVSIPDWIMIRAIPTFGGLILSPYLFILGVWLWKSRAEQDTPWLDEKQWQDTARAGLWTLLGTLPLVGVFYTLQFLQNFQGTWNYLWFPVYLFLGLLLFSSLTQWFYQQ